MPSKGPLRSVFSSGRQQIVIDGVAHFFFFLLHSLPVHFTSIHPSSWEQFEEVHFFCSLVAAGRSFVLIFLRESTLQANSLTHTYRIYLYIHALRGWSFPQSFVESGPLCDNKSDRDSLCSSSLTHTRLTLTSSTWCYYQTNGDNIHWIPNRFCFFIAIHFT